MTGSKTSSPTKPSHFPGLNTLRAYAAAAVIFSHINLNITPVPVVTAFVKYFFVDSQSAVSFFFVLSGFLISYLLLREQDNFGTVSLSRFYARRALRILPPHFLVSTVGLILFPLIFGSEYISLVFVPEVNSLLTIPVKTFLAFFLLPNFALLSGPMIHLWSIGVEAQFYILWPWIFRRKLNLVRVCMGIIIIKFTVTTALIFVVKEPILLGFFNGLRFESMAIGALGAYVYYKKLTLLRIIYHFYTQLLAWIVFISLIGRAIPTNAYATTGISICFVVLILNIATNPNSLVKLNITFTERLGRVSYGLYLYHFPILYVVWSLISRYFSPDETFGSFAIFLATLVFTWLASELSYRWFEKPMLNLKKHYASEPG